MGGLAVEPPTFPYMLNAWGALVADKTRTPCVEVGLAGSSVVGCACLGGVCFTCGDGVALECCELDGLL